MAEPPLFAPWRMDYILSLDKSPSRAPRAEPPCFICEAAAAPVEKHRDHLLLWATPQTVVIINRYPYTNGHLLVAPRAHKADLCDLTEEESTDIMRQTHQAIALLRKAVSAQGFNIGINLGHLAGAGLPGHVHQHVVPRWSGDTNFISVVGEVRVVPQAMSQLWEALVRVRKEMLA